LGEGGGEEEIDMLYSAGCTRHDIWMRKHVGKVPPSLRTLAMQMSEKEVRCVRVCDGVASQQTR
jgi:hypothetical protein